MTLEIIRRMFTSARKSSRQQWKKLREEIRCDGTRARHEGIKMAVRAGVRSIEHGSYLDEECMDLMIKNGTYLIPTLTIGLFFQESIPESKSLSKAVELGRKSKEIPIPI